MEKPQLSGRVAIVTGASRGIGASIAQALDRAGARVVVVARDIAALRAIAGGLQHDPVVFCGDLGDPEVPTTLVADVLDVCGGVDIVVNNAAAAARLDTVDTDAGVIDHLLAVNVRAPLLLVGRCVPSMLARGRGSIVNVSSVSALRGTPRRAAYAASKGAIDAMTRSLAIELGPQGIRVNAVAPGVVDTDLWAKNKAITGVVESVNHLTPLRRWGTGDEIADVVTFLASDASRFITGETIAVDGGMGATLDLFGGAV